MVFSLVESAKKRLQASKATPNNKELIHAYDLKLDGERLSEGRRTKFIDRLRWWALTLNKDFKKATRQDLEQAYSKLKNYKFKTSKTQKTPQLLKTSTINTYVTMLRQFYKHIEGDDDIFPDKIRKLKPMECQPVMISEDGETAIRIYSVDEIEKMIKLARGPREKCLVALSYDCGGRLSEILNLKMKHIKREPPFIKVYLHGNKTFKRSRVGPRWISVYYAVPYLNDYLKSHPFSLEDKEKPLWINCGKYGGKKDTQLSQSGFKTLFDRLKLKAGIEGKRFHDLRHTKCTHLLRLGMSETKVKKYLGHSMNSKQLGRYAHLVQDDVDEDLSRIYGLPFTRKKYDDIPIPIKCATCGEVNDAGSDLCKRCNNPISVKSITNSITRERYWKQKYEKGMSEYGARLEKLEKQRASGTVRETKKK